MEPAILGFCKRDVLRERRDRQIGTNDEVGVAFEGRRDVREILDHVERQGLQGRRDFPHADLNHQQRVGVGRLSLRCSAATIPPAPGLFSITIGWPGSLGRPPLWLEPAFCEIDRPAGRTANDEAQGFSRVGLALRRRRQEKKAKKPPRAALNVIALAVAIIDRFLDRAPPMPTYAR